MANAAIVHQVPAYQAEIAVDLDSAGSQAVTLQSVTAPGVHPGMVFTVNPAAALSAGIALGQPYCVTAGTLVVPIINPTGGAVDNASVTLYIVGH